MSGLPVVIVMPKTASDQRGRGGGRTPDICLVSEVAVPVGCAATTSTKATATTLAGLCRECARQPPRSGTSVARLGAATLSVGPAIIDHPGPSCLLVEPHNNPAMTECAPESLSGWARSGARVIEE